MSHRIPLDYESNNYKRKDQENQKNENKELKQATSFKDIK